MQKEFIKGIETLNKTTIESMKRLGEINGRAFERAASLQVAMVSDYLDASVRQFSLMGEVKDVQAVVAAQSRLVSDMGETMVAHAKKSADAFEASKAEYASWLEEGLKTATENPLAKQVAAKKAA